MLMLCQLHCRLRTHLVQWGSEYWAINKVQDQNVRDLNVLAGTWMSWTLKSVVFHNLFLLWGSLNAQMKTFHRALKIKKCEIDMNSRDLNSWKQSGHCSVTRPLCLVVSHTLDAAEKQERYLFTSHTFCPNNGSCKLRLNENIHLYPSSCVSLILELSAMINLR